MVFHCWTYRNEKNEWCVVENDPSSESDFTHASNEMLRLLWDLKKTLSQYSDNPIEENKVKQRQKDLAGTIPNKKPESPNSDERDKNKVWERVQ